jgi:hypothetical protein
VNWAERSAPIIEHSRGNLFDEAAKQAYLDLVNERLDAEGLRGKVWGAMHYVCVRCGSTEYRELEVGVEGPDHWRVDITYIACAFSAGRCHCGGLMTHARFSDDVDYEEPRDPVAKAVFRVPRQWPSYPTRGIRDDGTVIVGLADSAFLSLNLAGTR